MSRLSKWTTILLALFVFAIPIEHKYDKPLRHLSLRLIPDGLIFPRSFDKKIYFYATDLAAILLVVFALFAFRVPLRRLLFEKGAPFLWIIFACALASIWASPFSHYPVIYTRLLQLLTPILLFSFLAHVFPAEQKIKIVFSAFLAAALGQSAIAITQYFFQAPLGLHLLSEPQCYTGSFRMNDGSRWIFDQLFHLKSATTLILRACGTLPHCNVLGGFMALSLLASYTLIATTSKTWVRWLLGSSVIIQFFTLSITYSRSALFGWAIGTILWFGFAIYGQGLRSVYANRSLRFLSKMIVLSVFVSGALLFNQFTGRGGIVNYNTLAQESDQVRMSAQDIALQIVKEHPLLGIGYQQYNRGASALLPPGERPMGTHNIFLFLAAETGLISLAAFLCLIGALLIKAIRTPFSFQLASLLAIFTAFLFIGLCDFYPLLFQQGRLMFFAIAGLLAGACSSKPSLFSNA
jgi:hypothetical protein